MNTETKNYLTKEQELSLGRLIQSHYKAKEILESGSKLTPEEIKILNTRVAVGEKAIDKLVSANVGLVHKRAQMFKSAVPASLEIPDLVQEGMVGLMTAIKKYDPERNNKFSTVAYYWIAQAIARGSNKTSRLVRLPENRINDLTKISALHAQKVREGMAPEEIDEFIMDELGLSAIDLHNIRSAAAPVAYLSRPVSSDSSTSSELGDLIAAENFTESTEDSFLNEDMKAVLVEAVANLNQLHQDIILATFAVGDFESKSVDEVRAKYDLKQFQFKKEQSMAFDSLKEYFSEKGYSLGDFVENW